MKFICNDCGKVLDEDELIISEDKVSDYAGGTYERSATCTCGGSCKEASRCIGCGEYFPDEELSGGYCIDCLKESATVNNAIGCGNEEKSEIKINGFLAYLFSEKEIEEILKVALDKKINESDANAMKAMDEAQDFCMDDACWFAGWLDSQKQVA